MLTKIIISAVMVTLMLVGSVKAQTVTGVRSIGIATAGGTLDISINVNVNEAYLPNGFIIEEYIPAGWTLNSTSHNSMNRSRDGQISWLFGPFQNVADTTLNYQLSVPQGASGTHTFTGQLDYTDPANSAADTTTLVSGDITVTICSPTDPEICDGIDNDCDGIVDGITRPTATSCGVGECVAFGIETCTAGVWDETCTPSSPVAETCDNLDNNCNGSVDENVTRVTTCGVGECSSIGIETCTAGVWNGNTCTPDAPAGEICDNLDNNCNGTVDDGLSRGTTCGVGECSSIGIETCTSGAWGGNTCTSNSPTAEICDNLDNNCNGTVDDGLSRGTTCGVGECSSIGIETCTSGAWGGNTCTPYLPIAEICDSLDNNCNGVVDENVAQTTNCGVGECAGNTGIETCTNGVWVNDTCNPLAGAIPEGPLGDVTCGDTLDNDCDGVADGLDAECQQSAQSTMPEKINFQGYVTDSSNNPLNDTVVMLLSIYEVETGGTALWSETQNVTVNGGIFNVTLGDVNPIDLIFDVQYYLGVKIGTDPEMTPRKALTSVPYAFNSTGSIHVYDANNQYLGILLGTSSSQQIRRTIFIPFLGKLIEISTQSGESTYADLVRTSTDCTGETYTWPQYDDFIFKNGLVGGKYYTGQGNAPTVIQTESYNHIHGDCYTSGGQVSVVPVNEIQLPFNMPIALPFQYRMY